MLKYGLKRKRTQFEPEPTDREAYDKEMKALEKELALEVREDMKASRNAPEGTSDAAQGSAKPPVKRERAEASTATTEKETVKKEPSSHADEA